MAGPKRVLHFTETLPQEETAPNSPASNGVDILNRGLQTYCWVGFCHLLPLSPWLTLAEGIMYAHLRPALPPPQNNSSVRSNAWTYVVTGRQVCWGPTTPPSNGLGNVAIQSGWPGFQLPQMMSKSTGEQNKDQETLPSKRQAENKKRHVWVLSLNASLQPSSFPSSP